MLEEKERLEKEAVALRMEAARAIDEKAVLESKLTQLLSERDSIQLKIEAMLEAITMIDSDVAEAVGR
jgi:predicted  nucleic acid-binding Zn-ribbon protein